MKFCYNCGNSPKGAATGSVTGPSKVEYKQVVLNLYERPFTKLTRTSLEEQEKGRRAAEQRVLKALKPFFDEGWQLDGTFNSAVSLLWNEGMFVDDRLKEASVRLIRYV